MPLSPSLADIAVRILLTVIACAAIGYERGEHGKAAGLRTVLLVGLAACLAAVQMNLLLPVGGKTPESFSVMDVMRLPLGILSGVGFIGAGAILRRDNMVVGLTTAATLWYVTVLGLCFGGGQVWLGLAGLVLGVVIVQVLRVVEPRLHRDRMVRLNVKWDRSRLDRVAIEAMAVAPQLKLVRASMDLSNDSGTGELCLQLRWQAIEGDHSIPEIVEQIAAREGVIAVSWDPGGLASA